MGQLEVYNYHIQLTQEVGCTGWLVVINKDWLVIVV